MMHAPELAAADLPLPPDWIECSAIGIPGHVPRPVRIMFVNTANGVGMKDFPPGKWSVVDVSKLVPPGTKAVGLAMFLVITHGTTTEIADLRVAFRRHGETRNNADSYTQQAVEAHVGGGIRTTGFEVVPLSDDGKFEITWSPVPMPANWPTWSAYCVNVGLACWFK
jgi:hypothetical protein